MRKNIATALVFSILIIMLALPGFIVSSCTSELRVPPSPVGTYHWPDPLDLGMVAPVANTGSMEPTLNGTTFVGLTKDPVHIGDIAVYGDKNGTIIHRIIGEQEGNWIFKGDHSGGIEIIPKDKVLWRVKTVIY